MGIGIVLVCAMLWFRERWFLSETVKGKRLVQWLGDNWALWVLRGILIGFAALGTLLASGVIRPIRWERSVSDASDARAPRALLQQHLHLRPVPLPAAPTQLADCSLQIALTL